MELFYFTVGPVSQAANVTSEHNLKIAYGVIKA
jgi:hypothetical protein